MPQGIRGSFARPCNVLPFIVHAAQSSIAFHGDGFIRSKRLDITDRTFSIALISGLFADQRRSSIVALERHPWLILNVWGVTPSCIKTTLSANACSDRHDAWGFHQYNSVQLSVNMARGIFRAISILMQVLYCVTPLNPTWNRKIKRLLCLVKNRCLTF